MKKIVICSDNHYDQKVLQKIRDLNKDAYMFIHCGDSEAGYRDMRGFAAVAGNNDYDPEYPQELVLEVEGHKVFVTHGHRYMWFGQYDRLLYKADSLGCDIVCFGHTHIYTDIEDRGIRLLNPGSLRMNRDMTPPSYMIMKIDKNSIQVERVNVKK